MPKNKKKKVIPLLLAAALCLFCLGGIWEISRLLGSANEQGENGKHQVALITKSTVSAFWQSVFAGARAAGTEYNLTVKIEGPENEEDYETQNEMIQKAVEDGAEVLVFSAVDFQENAKMIDWAATKGVKTIVIDSDVNSEKVLCRIETDNFAAGAMAAKAVQESGLAEKKVGIVNYDKNSANGQQREAGFREAVKNDTETEIVDAINVRSTTEDAKAGTKEMLERHPEINVIVTFNEWTSLGVGYAVQECHLADGTMVVAFDSNVVSVGMLESGEVDALIVQNPYAMGYLGVEKAFALIQNRGTLPSQIDTETTLITRENMFDPQCQRMLFAFENG